MRWSVDNLKKLANRHTEFSRYDFGTLAETRGPTAFPATQVNVAISIRKVLAIVAMKTVALVQ